VADRSDTPFAGIDRTTAEPLVGIEEDATQWPLTPEEFEELWERAMRPSPPPIEVHHPRCPKILTRCRKACRCGAAPTEAIFEDELDAG